jgi:hypothetical protein
MKKYILHVSLIFATLFAHAQHLTMSPQKVPQPIQRVSGNHIFKPVATTGSRAATQAVISYLDDNYAYYLTDPTFFQFDFVNEEINLRYPNNKNFTYRYIAVLFDSLINVTGVYPSVSLGTYVGKTVRVDSVRLYYYHKRNITNKPDTLRISVFNMNNASITGTGANATLNTVALWSQTLNAVGNDSLNSQGIALNPTLYYKTFPVNVTLPTGAPFGVRVDYQGDTANKFFVPKFYRDDCGGTCLYAESTVPGNSIGYLNYVSGNTNLSGFNTLGFDCDLSGGPLDPTQCEILTGDFYIISFVTVFTPSAPTATTQPATNITSSSATLNGIVNPEGLTTQVFFDWGLTTSYGNTVNATPASLSANYTSTSVSANLSGLTPNTTYHFRVRAVNNNGTTNGNNLTFSTPPSGSCTPSIGMSGFNPPSSAIPCAVNTQFYSQDISFAVPASLLNFTVNSVRVDSIRNVPAGLTATLNQNPPVYSGGTNGCYRLEGIPNAPCGQYKILFYVTVNTNFGSQSGELSALASQFGIAGYEPIFIRVVNSGIPCPAVNTSQTANFSPINCTPPNISVSMSKTDVICNTLGTATATPSGGTNYSFNWSNGATTPTITGLSPGTYTVTVTETNFNTTATGSVTINSVASNLSVSASQGAQPGCGQANGTAIATVSGGTPIYSFAWNTNPVQTGPTATGLTAGNYTVTVTDQNGCTATASVVLTNPNAPTPSISGNTTICAGNSTTLTASGGTTYNWSNNLGNNASVTVAPSVNTTYSVTVSNANGCSAFASVTVTVKQPSSSTINQSICQGNSYFFNGQQLTQSGTYKDTLQNAVGCDSIITLILTVNPLPNPIITQNGNVLSTGTFATYQWRLNNNNIPNATSSTYTATQNGSYTVVVTDANGCSNTSAPVVVSGVGIGEIAGGFFAKILPNPNHGSFKLIMNDSHVYEVTITNLIGKILLNAYVQKEQHFYLPEIPAGIYLLNIKRDADIKTLKFSLIK